MPRNKSTGQSKPVERLSHQVSKPVATSVPSRLAGPLFSKNKVGGTGTTLGTGKGYTSNFSKIVGTFVQCHRINVLTNAGKLGNIDMNPITPFDDDEAQGNLVLPRSNPFPPAFGRLFTSDLVSARAKPNIDEMGDKSKSRLLKIGDIFLFPHNTHEDHNFHYPTNYFDLLGNHSRSLRQVHT